MKILIADEAGFCFGVKRAAEIVIAQSQDKQKINTLGPLIHNNQFTTHLESKNIFSVDSVDNINAKKVVIRSHGIEKKIENSLKNKGFSLVDATCPFVKRVHKLAESLEQEGYKIVIFGEKDHPEVIGIKSYAKNPIVVKDIKDLSKFKIDEKIALISQTTQNLKKFEKLANYLKENYKYTRIHNTICDATEKRQLAAQDLANKVDLMIVIGGKHSSNTSRLYDVCSEKVETYHIETEVELRKNWFLNKNKVGLTAGASTPDFIIEKVIKKIKSYE